MSDFSLGRRAVLLVARHFLRQRSYLGLHGKFHDADAGVLPANHIVKHPCSGCNATRGPLRQRRHLKQGHQNHTFTTRWTCGQAPTHGLTLSMLRSISRSDLKERRWRGESCVSSVASCSSHVSFSSPPALTVAGQSLRTSILSRLAYLSFQ